MLLFSQTQKRTFIRRKLKSESEFFEVGGGGRRERGGGGEGGEIGWEGGIGGATEETE